MQTKRRSESPFDKVIEDGILSRIISSFPLRDAFRTSILSRRWRHICEEIPFLNLDSTNLFGEDILDLKDVRNTELKDAILHGNAEARNAYLTKLAEKFVLAVDTVLGNRKSCGTESFRLDFYFRRNYFHHLDKWLLHGIGSNTKALAVILDPPTLPTNQEPYDFPCHHFINGRGSSIELLLLTYCSLKPSPNFKCFKHLKVLELKKVHVTDKGIQEFLSNSSVLEWLSIGWCNQLVSLKVAQPLSRLKFFRVSCCASLQEIEFHAPELNSFEFTGDRVSLKFSEVGKLTLARMCLSDRWHALQYALTDLPRDLPHLRTLYLEMQNLYEVVNLPQLPQIFYHLRRLVMIVWMDSPKNLLLLSSILVSAPFLEQLELHLVMQFGEPLLEEDDEREIERLTNCHYKYLKRVEISGFFPTPSQIEIAIHLLENAVALESMTINPRMRYYSGFDSWIYANIPSVANDIIDHHLRREVPSHVQLEIL